MAYTRTHNQLVHSSSWNCHDAIAGVANSILGLCQYRAQPYGYDWVSHRRLIYPTIRSAGRSIPFGGPATAMMYARRGRIEQLELSGRPGTVPGPSLAWGNELNLVQYVQSVEPA